MKYLKSAALTVTALTLAGCGGMVDSSPAPTVTVTATPETVQSPTSAPTPSEAVTELAAPVESPAAAAEPSGPPAPTQEAGLTPAAAVHQYLANEPWYGQPEQGTSIVESVAVENDDVIIRLVTSSEANATKNYAPSIIADSTRTLQAHRDDPAIAGLDLLAVYSADGVMVGSDSISGLPQAAS